jgi:hypothetical protein
MNHLEATNSASESQAETERKPYQKPVLTEYGTLAKLTHGGGGGAADRVGMTMAACSPGL